MGKVTNALKHAWNAFNEEEKLAGPLTWESTGVGYGIRPDRLRLNVVNDKTMIGSIYNRIGIDASTVDIRHVKVDEEGNYLSTVKSSLNFCLNDEANIDQEAQAFKQDAVMTLCDKGTIAIVPVDTSVDPNETGSYDIKTLRVGEIVKWMPKHVRILLYNDISGKKEEITMAKKDVAIVENPLYTVMNEPNGTQQRLIRKLSLLDSLDEQAGSGKLDLIIQLPYVIKSEARKQQAEQRRKDIEVQLQGSKYGIAYTDGTERITQLNRPAENNMLAHVQALTDQLYSQLGLTPEVFNGTADERTMLNYYNRTINPILTAITQAMKRAFLTRTARTQGHSIEYYRDPFALVSVTDMSEIADKFTRNEIMSANEVRAGMGMRPSTEAKANQLRNSNMPTKDTDPVEPATQEPPPPTEPT